LTLLSYVATAGRARSSFPGDKLETTMEEMNLMPTLAEADAPRVTGKVPAELLEPSPLEQLKAADEARPGFPGEHWLVLAGGARRNRAGRAVEDPALHAAGQPHFALPAVRAGRAGTLTVIPAQAGTQSFQNEKGAKRALSKCPRPPPPRG
jgi:hypothetical protein